MNSFDNTEIAFKLKTDKDLKNSEFLFSFIQKPQITKVGVSILNSVIKWNLPFVKNIVKNTLFKQFCGGETMEECIPVIDHMYGLGVSSVLDYSVEGKAEEATFEKTFQEILTIIRFSANKEPIPFSVFKPTGVGRFELYEKVNNKLPLSETESLEWEKIREKYYKICELASEKEVLIMIDAEESWIQDAVDELTEELMQKFNVNKCVVYGTLQMYRTGRLDFLKSQYEKAKNGNYYIGFKIVRGAYMEKERERAKEKGYPSPIQSNKENTDKQYNESLKFVIENREVISLFAGSHNEKSCKYLKELIKKHNIDTDSSKIWFGQLYGMSDNISFNLGAEKYNIAKYLPYGPVVDVVPYLTRRAEENTSVAGQTGRELSYIKKEQNRRKKI